MFWMNIHFGRAVVWCGVNLMIIYFFKASISLSTSRYYYIHPFLQIILVHPSPKQQRRPLTSILYLNGWLIGRAQDCWLSSHRFKSCLIFSEDRQGSQNVRVEILWGKDDIQIYFMKMTRMRGHQITVPVIILQERRYFKRTRENKQMQDVALNISQIPFLSIPLVGNMLPFHTRVFFEYQNVIFSVKDGTGSNSDADTQKTCSIYCIYVKTTFYFL